MTFQKGNKLGFKHGHESGGKQSLTYRSYWDAWSRCTNPSRENYSSYGGAKPPVTWDERWIGKHAFENFIAVMGEKPEGKSLGRIADKRHYGPDTCEWRTPAEHRIHARLKKISFGGCSCEIFCAGAVCTAAMRKVEMGQARRRLAIELEDAKLSSPKKKPAKVEITR